MEELVSIIVPLFNSESTISETIESVLDQTYPHWEMLIVNDGSTDNSLNVIEQFRDPRIKVFSQQNGGVSTARNLGISQASGTYIAFLDSDDLWEKHKLELSVQALQVSDADLVYTDVKVFSTNKYTALPYRYSEQLTEEDDYFRLLIYDYVPTLTVVTTRRILEQVGYFDTNLHGTEDWDLWVRIAKVGRLCFIPEPLSLYRHQTNGLSKNRDAHLFEEAKVLKKHLKFDRNIPEIVKRKAYWVWNKKMFVNNIKKRRFMGALKNYLNMLHLCPMVKYNYLFFVKTNG